MEQSNKTDWNYLLHTAFLCLITMITIYAGSQVLKVKDEQKKLAELLHQQPIYRNSLIVYKRGNMGKVAESATIENFQVFLTPEHARQYTSTTSGGAILRISQVGDLDYAELEKQFNQQKLEMSEGAP